MNRRHFFANLTGASNDLVSLNTMSNIGDTKTSREVISSLINNNDKVLVVIQLIGGNDCLNTVVPLDRYDVLMKHRGNIMLEQNRLLKINDTNAFHPKFKHVHELNKQGNFSYIQNVGYPNQNRSHFRSMDIYNSGSRADEMLSSGWLGRYLDIFHPSFPMGYPNDRFKAPLSMTIGNIVADTCQGNLTNYAYALNHLNSIELLYEHSINGSIENEKTKYQLNFYNDVIRLTNKYSTIIKKAQERGSNLVEYPPNNVLAQQLKAVAELISGGLETKIYTLTMGGFDTHAFQTMEDRAEGWHATLLDMLSEAVYAFQTDLNKLGVADKVLTMTYTEFGRQIKSNAAMGTDHGSAGSMYFFGKNFKNNIIGSNPNIADEIPDQTGLELEFDFRDVYSTILVKWFGLEQSHTNDIFSRDTKIIQNFI